MKISKNLFQFPEKSLLVVASTNSVEIYFAFNGEIDKKDFYETEKESYSDKEGFFVRSGKGKVYGTGSVLEVNKQEKINQFLKEAKKIIEKNFQEIKPDSVYLFSPDYLKNDLERHLSNEVKLKTKREIKGNFIGVHCFDLIKKIDKESKKKRLIVAGEKVFKILKRKK